MKTLRPILIIVTLMLMVGMACNLGASQATPSSSGNNNPTSAPAPTAEQAATSAAQSSGGDAISVLSDAQKAVIQIESQGTFVDPQVGLVVNGAGRGSGFIIDPSGIAVTNNHVVTGSALLKVWVEGVQHNARILGVSECSDLAVIKIEGGPYPYLNWYNQAAKTGLEVYAAGFPLGEPQFSLTKGIISKEKADGQTSWASLDYTLGHDATINPGNSGGPLITGKAEVVGINYSSLASANQYFAIDELTAKPVVDELSKGKDIDSLGINGTAVKSDDGKLSGIWVASVKSGSPADKSGVKPGDILYQMESLVLATDGTMKDYCNILRTHKPEDTLSLTVIRYASGELLEGQINGRELKVTGNFDTGGSGGSGGTTGGTTGGKDFFTDTFDTNDLSNYSYFLMKGDESRFKLGVDGGYLVFDLQGTNLWTYVTYDPFTYTDVRIDIVADNRGRNNNNVSLVCRYSKDGWYEFNIANSGIYDIYYVADGNYYPIKNGGSTLIKQGKGVNEYTAICSGTNLTLGINGTEVTTVSETKYNLREGQVGFGVSSFNVTPIRVDLDSFQVSQP
jgi:S1-C subfamily serine protease